MCFYLKWCEKIKIQYKKNTKTQPKKTVCETVNFVSTKLNKPKILSRNTKEWHNTFIIFL